jgi:hypothetical protein
METRKVYDPSGSWLINNGSFPFQDPETGSRFEPGVPTQALKSEWVKSQPVIGDWANPAATKKVEDKPAK